MGEEKSITLKWLEEWCEVRGFHIDGLFYSGMVIDIKQFLSAARTQAKKETRK